MLAVGLLVAMTGCHAIDLYTPSVQATTPPELAPPRELSMVSLPPYRIQPPDVLRLSALRLVPRPPYRVANYDVLKIEVLGTIIDQPIYGYFLVEGDGIVTLGPAYGTVRVEGMTIEEATAAVSRHLRVVLQRPFVSIELVRAEGTEQVSMNFLVQPDGMLNLRRYGMVHVSGMTVPEAKLAVEKHLRQYFDSPEVSVEVIDYRSQIYYVIAAGAGQGESIQRFPITGKETVLDAIGQMQGISRMSSKTMWVARPTPGKMETTEILPVDWTAIARGGVTDTNYQILPGDRIYIVDDKVIAANNYLAKVTDPIQRLLNITSLSGSMIQNMETTGRAYNQNRRGY